MKLIEKLATKETALIAAEAPFYHRPSLEAAYVAGFRKAREMAYQLMAKGDPKCFGLDVDIENLGEEEV